MGKKDVKIISKSAKNNAPDYLDVLNARNKFFAATLGMGWRLAITVLIPLIAGIKVDDRFDSSPLYTLVGFTLSIIGGSLVVWDSVKQVNISQAEQEKLDNQKESKT